VSRSDVVTITGLRASAFHGVHQHERRSGQVFIIDVVAQCDLAEAAASDDLTKTLDYSVLTDQIVAAVERDPVNLIETIAERVVQVVLAHEIVASVRVTVHKPDAPLSATVDDVSVSIERSRR
jgi:7,8-dihydroneopterin aldolase/epimerase/oxygenase